MRPKLLPLAAVLLSLSCACQTGGGGNCTPTTCLGCCDSKGNCEKGDSATFCGAKGNTCLTCAAGTSCVSAKCPGGTATGGSGTGGSTGTGGDTGTGGSTGAGGGTATVCPPGLQCNVTCTGSATTTISGRVYDPAKKNPLYNATVYVPETDLVALPKGVPVGAALCSCTALFASGAVVSTVTAEDGSFTLKNAPVGADVHLVIQIGKWRKLFHVNVIACQDNPQAEKSLAFPGSVPAGNTDDNIPDIAVSTGSSDTLECLMRRIGLPTTEYVAGAGTTGHVHVFSGGKTGQGGNNNVGKPEGNIMPGSPESATHLWQTKDQLMPYDIVLLSCEGGETYNANPPALEEYLNVGGRAFASHFHYAWFAGPLSSNQNYSAPADWGNHLASWASGGGQNNGSIGGIIDTVLNASTQAFPKGVALQKWLSDGGTLGIDTAPPGEVAIYQPRFNATVGTSNPVSQTWITADQASGMGGATMYFSFDTPANAPNQPDGGAPSYCGRAVFSDLHVAGNPKTNDNPPPPDGCADVDLSPQEKVLEFMLFDLSSCVIADTVAPPITIN